MTLSRRQLEDGLEMFVCDLLDADERDAFERALESHPDLRAEADEIRRGLIGLALDGRTTAPEQLRVGTLLAAADRRTPGVQLDAPAAAAPLDCYRVTATDLTTVLSDLDDAELVLPTAADRHVADLVLHLAGMEDVLVSVLHDVVDGCADVSVAANPHSSVTVAADDPIHDDLVAGWRERRRRLEDAAAQLADTDLEQVVHVGAAQLSVRALLAARAFEIWTHTDDIRRATGRPLAAPSGPVLRRLAHTAIELLEPVVQAFGDLGDRTYRITLTGDGGGSWLGRTADSSSSAPLPPFTIADATITADVVDFCRLMADRIEVDELHVDRSGDPAVHTTVTHLATCLADYGDRLTGG